MNMRIRCTRLGLIAVAAFAFAASLSAVAADGSCEGCRIEWNECLSSHLPQDLYVCDQRYIQCYVPLNCPISNF